MRRILISFVCIAALTQASGQKKKPLSLYLTGQYNATLYDQTEENNPWGIGYGVRMVLNPENRFQPVAEFTHTGYLMSYKVLLAYSDGTPVPSVRTMSTLFAGGQLHVSPKIYASFLAGPAFINGKTLLGIQPAVGFYFSRSRKWTGRISYINIYDRNERSYRDFGSLNYSLAIRLF